jgi:hypothetical protein
LEKKKNILSLPQIKPHFLLLPSHSTNRANPALQLSVLLHHGSGPFLGTAVGEILRKKRIVLPNENRLCQLNAGCEVLTAVAMISSVFWDIVLYGWV